MAEGKSQQLQVRVTAQEKARVRRSAKACGMGMSEWLLSRALPQSQRRFYEICRRAAKARRPGFALAELNDFLVQRTRDELILALAEAPEHALSRYLENYIAAMVEMAAQRKGFSVPVWVERIPRLDLPVFGVDFSSLRLHLLLASPLPFRRRNIFIDASLGERV